MNRVGGAVQLLADLIGGLIEILLNQTADVREVAGGVNIFDGVDKFALRQLGKSGPQYLQKRSADIPYVYMRDIGRSPVFAEELPYQQRELLRLFQVNCEFDLLQKD